MLNLLILSSVKCFDFLLVREMNEFRGAAPQHFLPTDDHDRSCGQRTGENATDGVPYAAESVRASEILGIIPAMLAAPLLATTTIYTEETLPDVYPH